MPPEMKKAAKTGRILLSDLESKDRERLAQGMLGRQVKSRASICGIAKNPSKCMQCEIFGNV